MDELDHKKEALHDFAGSRERDSHGHFIPRPHTVIPEHAPTPDTVHPLIEALVPHGIEVDHKVTNDDLVDVHVGNPLRKITALLEEIKKQKAFSFTLKGSLGIMGVVLAVSTFGIFSGGKMLCDKGIQTERGTLQILSVSEDQNSPVPFIGNAIDFYHRVFPPKNPTTHPRTVLVTKDSIIYVPYEKDIPFASYKDHEIYATGTLNTCSRTLQITTPKALELLSNNLNLP